MEQLLDFETKSLEELEPYINEEGFIWACKKGHLKIVKWVLAIKPDIDISIDNDYACRLACENGHLEVAKWLYNHLKKKRILPLTFRTACVFNNLEIAKFIYLTEPYINISEDDEYIFRTVCEYGHLDIAKWLLSIKPDIDISIKDEYAFRWACYGHLEVAKWLISIKPDINIDAFHNDDDNEAYADWHDDMDDHEYSEMFDDERNKTAFIKVCESNNLEIAQWLCKLNKKYHIEFKNDNILNYYVL